MQRHILKLWLFVGLVGLVGTARADDPGIELQNYTFRPAGNAKFSIGWTFQLSHPITITALGTMDFGGNSIATDGPMPVALYYSSATAPNVGTTSDGFHTSGTPVAGASVIVTATDPIMAPNGGPYVSGDGFRYHMLDTPITLYSDPQVPTLPKPGYEIQAANMGSGYATNWASVTNDGVIGPIAATYSMNTPSTPDYETNVFTSFGQAFAGPNFLIQTPEPTAIALVAVGTVALIRRR